MAVSHTAGSEFDCALVYGTRSLTSTEKTRPDSTIALGPSVDFRVNTYGFLDLQKRSAGYKLYFTRVTSGIRDLVWFQESLEPLYIDPYPFGPGLLVRGYNYFVGLWGLTRSPLSSKGDGVVRLDCDHMPIRNSDGPRVTSLPVPVVDRLFACFRGGYCAVFDGKQSQFRFVRFFAEQKRRSDVIEVIELN